MLQLSFDDLKKSTVTIVEKINKSGYQPTFLVGVTVGGLIPLALIAKELEMQKVTTISASAYDEESRKDITVHVLPDVDLSKERVLLIDDISDTGGTLRDLSKLLIEKYNVQEIKTATFVVRVDKKMYRPDFYAIESEEWTEFPWEKGIERMRNK